jgi:hypothetical protein
MGGQLVVEAARSTGMDRMPHFPRLVLLLMAAHALDKPKGDNPARVYWGGQRLIAIEIYGPHEWGRDAWTRKEIKHAIRDLHKRGLIRVHSQQHGGVTTYELLPRGGGSQTPGVGGA